MLRRTKAEIDVEYSKACMDLGHKRMLKTRTEMLLNNEIYELEKKIHELMDEAKQTLDQPTPGTPL